MDLRLTATSPLCVQFSHAHTDTSVGCIFSGLHYFGMRTLNAARRFRVFPKPKLCAEITEDERDRPERGFADFAPKGVAAVGGLLRIPAAAYRFKLHILPRETWVQHSKNIPRYVHLYLLYLSLHLWGDVLRNGRSVRPLNNTSF